mmetsp:Transcript_21451/g.35518  ORF Transcript_21451/g.35518 Transcript_21451/m.35518 type:complete len:261 (-) Transcript_21451:80-862(-)
MTCQRTFYNPSSRTITSIISTKLQANYAPGAEVLAMMRHSTAASLQQQPEMKKTSVPSPDESSSHIPCALSSHEEGGSEKPPKQATRSRPAAQCSKKVDTAELRCLGADYEINNHDVMCGRGKGTLYNNGNRVFRQIIASFLDRFLSSKKRVDKQACIAEVIDVVRDSGGHFLKRDNSTLEWYDIGDKAAAAKIGHSLRDLKSEELRRFQKKPENGPKMMKDCKQTKKVAKKDAWRHREIGDISAARSMQLLMSRAPRFA